MKIIANKKRAFTLVELLVVIAIIGILFVVLISKVDFATDKARAVGVEADLRSFEIAVNTVGLKESGFVDDIELLAYQLNENLDSHFSVSVSDGNIITNAKDPWGTTYRITYLAQKNGNGQIIIASAGSDLKHDTIDDIVLAMRYVDSLNGGSVQSNFLNGRHTLQSCFDHQLETFFANAAKSVRCGTEELVTFVCPDCYIIAKENVIGVQHVSDEWNNCIGCDLIVKNNEWVEDNRTISDYSWSDIQSFAKLKLTAEEYKNRYNIELGQKFDNTYTLVDFNAYDGFVFMYQSGNRHVYNNEYNNAGGYAASDIAVYVDGLFETLPVELQNVIKAVDIQCVDGKANYTNTYNYFCRLFLPSHSEVGGTGFESGSNASKYNAVLKTEGLKFDYFAEGNNTEEANLLRQSVAGSTAWWWVRSARADYTVCSWAVSSDGTADHSLYVNKDYAVVPCFVVG